MNSEQKHGTELREVVARAVSDTPTIALLNRRLGTSPAPRMLTPYEIDLLRRCVKEAVEVSRAVPASSEATSEN